MIILAAIISTAILVLISVAFGYFLGATRTRNVGSDE